LVAFAHIESPWLLSAMRTLVQLLQQRAMKVHRVNMMPPRLRFALKLVQERALKSLTVNRCKILEGWQELLHTLPDLEGKCNQKDLLLFQKACVEWHAAICEDRGAAWIANLESRTSAALGEVQIRQLRAALRSAVAALAPPRAKSTEHILATPMDNGDTRGSQMGLQKRLRLVVLRILDSGLIRVDDPEICPMVQRLRHLFNIYSKNHGEQDFANSTSGKQWARLHAFVDTPTESHSTSIARPFDQKVQSLPSSIDPSGLPEVAEINLKVVECPGVHKNASPILVRCMACCQQLICEWVVQRKGRAKVIVPCHGHSGCVKTTLDKAKQLHPVDLTIRRKTDHPNNFTFCKHNVLWSGCYRCRPAYHCEHGIRRTTCQGCRAKGLVSTRK